MRTFISIDIVNPLIKQRVIEFQGKFSSINTVKFIDPEQLHFTIKFLGEIDSSLIDDIILRLKRIKFSKFTMDLNSLGSFPNDQHISIIWAGVDSNSMNILEKLCKKINEQLSDLFPPDPRKFTAHVTLARVKSKKLNSEIINILHDNSKLFFGQNFVNNFSFKRSKLTSYGPVYSNLYDFNLNGSD